jgi:hypothetical protein
LFWAAWSSVVCATNVVDGLKALQLLPDLWSFASGNYQLMVKVTGIHHLPAWAVAVLFGGVVAWEELAVLLFRREFGRFRARDHGGSTIYSPAFAVSLALWAAFMVVDEVLIIYDIEGTHRSLFVCGLVSLLALRLLPDE